MQHTQSGEYWSSGRKTAFRFTTVFALLFVNSFSFPHRYIPDPGKYTGVFFESAAAWCADHLFHLQKPYVTDLVSDSTGMYINIPVLLFISLMICLLWTMLDRQRPNYKVPAYWFRTFISYYLAMQLFAYGFSKLFKWQFYLPEPNILFTMLGDIPRDLLFWSAMGSSRPYTMFTGLVETGIGFLLLFRRTRLAGALLATGVMSNVLMINLCFDISVKIYSAFLLLLSMMIVAPEAKRIFLFFAMNIPLKSDLPEPVYTGHKFKYYLAGKTLIILLMLADALAPYFASNNFNDDLAERPLLHGAYNVNTFVRNNDTLPPIMTDTLRWKRIFVHRRGYLIIQGMNDRMEDYVLDYDTLNKELFIEDPDSGIWGIKYLRTNDSILSLKGIIRGDTLSLSLKKVNSRDLALLQNEFHWTSDF